VAKTAERTWTTDLLGEPYEQTTLDLPPDEEGAVVVTVVRRRAEWPTKRAVLYIHGYADYFFQTHLADFWINQGYHFYAIDLRKNGRSLREHQTIAFCRNLGEYAADLDAAHRLILEDGPETLVINAHSTGGLIAPLWAHARRAHRDGRGLVDALLLNSPFLDLPVPAAMRTVSDSAIGVVGQSRPMTIIPSLYRTPYMESISNGHYGEWEMDLTWKPVGGVPLRAGWLRAILAAQRRVHAGLEVPCPVLVASSAASIITRGWDESLFTADAVLDVRQMARWAAGLGRLVTIQRINGGMHDLALSKKPARDAYFEAMQRWIWAYGPKEEEL
jgi:alpha-beta hydrolase superfamily lysophospholipase